MGKDLEDLEKELKKSVKKGAEFGEDLKKGVKTAGKSVEKDIKMHQKYSKKDKDSDWFVWLPEIADEYASTGTMWYIVTVVAIGATAYMAYKAFRSSDK